MRSSGRGGTLREDGDGTLSARMRGPARATSALDRLVVDLEEEKTEGVASPSVADPIKDMIEKNRQRKQKRLQQRPQQKPQQTLRWSPM